MSFCKFCTHLTTGKDNQTFDIVRVAMAGVTLALVAVMFLGVGVYVYGYMISITNPNAKLFDIQTFFSSVSTYAVATSAFLMGGASALYFKRSTEPDGTQTTVESIKSGAGAAEPTTETTRITTNTNIVTPGQ